MKPVENKKHQSFADWVSENKPCIESHLIHEGLAFINAQGENLRQPVLHLVLDNRWHYMDKPTKKQSYRAQLTENRGIPWLKLTYYTFRHGGYSQKFDCKAVLKQLWQQARGGQEISPVIQPKPQTPVIKPPVINWQAQALALWNTLSPTGVSHYLRRKGLADCLIPGIRFAPRQIAISIIDTQSTFHGLQHIFNDGNKRFTKSLSKKGHFAVIGEDSLPQHPKTIHVCEGVATAASIYLAIGEPVFSALDAFNLLPVCKSLKRRYPKTPIIIWADNDAHKAEKQTKFGGVIGNTGLIQANRTAFKLRNARVCTPDFSQLNSELTKTATDFNDLHLLAGLSALVETIPRQPDIALALWYELKKYNKYAHGIVSPSQFNEGVKQTYESRYLPVDVFAREGVHLVRSAIGTGKTAIVEHLVKQNPDSSILFMTHLISLVESAAQRLHLTSYNQCDVFDLQMEDRLAICLNSLGKLTAQGSLKHYDVVIIDEIEQVLARLTTHIEQKPLVFSVLQYLMHHAKTLICLDAHLSKATVELIKSFCPDKPVTIHFNTFEPSQAREIAFHESPESIQMQAMSELEENRKVYLAFNSKKEAFRTFSTFNTAYPEKKGLYISGDNAGDAENQAFFNDVNLISKQYDYVICTPSVSTGVSIDNNHFDFVGGVFSAQVNTANDCMQALGRIRNHPQLHVFCDKRIQNKPLNPEVIASRWSSTHQHDLNLMNLNGEGERILMSPDYERLVLTVTQARNMSLNDFYQQFCLLALHDGMGLTYLESEVDSDTKHQLRQFKKACTEQDTAAIAQEKLPLNAMQLKALANKPRKTMTDTRQFKKQQLMEFYNLNERDEENIQAMAALDNDGQFKKKIQHLELALGDVELAKKRFTEQLNNGARFAPDLTHYATLQQLYQQLLKTLYLTTGTSHLNTADYRYTADTILASGFIDWIEQHRSILQGVINIPYPDQLQRDPLRFLSMLLSKLGLKQKRVGRAEEGVYHLNPERTQLLNALIRRRNAGLAGQACPLDTSSCKVKAPATTEMFIETFRKIKAFFNPKYNDFVFA